MGKLEEKYNLDVVFEDNHILVINKKPGQIAQGDKTGDIALNDIVKNYLREKYEKPGNVYLGLIHRLDRPTSGGLIFGKTEKATVRLSKMFQNHEINKTYWAVVDRMPAKEEDTLVHYLAKNEEKNKSFTVKAESKNAKKAVLHYKYLASINNYHLLEVKLETGRHHQIRAQLATIGCHIKGDVKYGFKRPNIDGSIHLHSRYIQLVHPVTKENLVFIFPLPPDPVWKQFE